MTHHAKAPSAGSTEGSGDSRGLFRRALASTFGGQEAVELPLSSAPPTDAARIADRTSDTATPDSRREAAARGGSATPSTSHNLDGTRAPSRGRAVLCSLMLIALGAAPAPAALTA